MPKGIGKQCILGKVCQIAPRQFYSFLLKGLESFVPCCAPAQNGLGQRVEKMSGHTQSTKTQMDQ